MSNLAISLLGCMLGIMSQNPSIQSRTPREKKQKDEINEEVENDENVRTARLQVFTSYNCMNDDLRKQQNYSNCLFYGSFWYFVAKIVLYYIAFQLVWDISQGRDFFVILVLMILVLSFVLYLRNQFVQHDKIVLKRIKEYDEAVEKLKKNRATARRNLEKKAIKAKKAEEEAKEIKALKEKVHDKAKENRGFHHGIKYIDGKDCSFEDAVEIIASMKPGLGY